MSGNGNSKQDEAWGDDLTAKQRAFCREYLIDLNATQAAIRAGYSEASAYSIGQENLTKPEIQACVQILMNKRAKRVDVSGDRVLEELCAMAFYDPAELVGVEILCPKDILKLPERVRRCIIGWSWDKMGNFTLKLSAKTQQLDLLGRHLKLFTDKIEHTGANGVPLVETMPAEVVDQVKECMAEVRASLKPPGS